MLVSPVKAMPPFAKFKTITTFAPILFGTPISYRIAMGTHLIEPLLLLRGNDRVVKLNSMCIIINATFMLATEVAPRTIYIWSILKTLSIALLYSFSSYDNQNLNEYYAIPMLQTHIHVLWKYMCVLFVVQIISQRIVLKRQIRIICALLNALTTRCYIFSL